MAKAEIHNYALTREEAEACCGNANVAIQILTQQMANPELPASKVDEAAAMLKRNKLLYQKLARPLAEADAKKAAAGPLAHPPQNRAARRKK